MSKCLQVCRAKSIQQAGTWQESGRTQVPKYLPKYHRRQQASWSTSAGTYASLLFTRVGPDLDTWIQFITYLFPLFI